MEKDVKEFSTATEKLIQVDIEKEMRESFLQYSMAVLVSRALPDVRDGIEACTQKNNIHDERGRQYIKQAVQKMCLYGR